MAEYQLTSWRDLPSLVVARESADPTDSAVDPADTVKIQLAPRFQEAIDEAAMRLGDTGSDAYLEGWTRGGWTTDEGSAAEVADRVVAALEARWTDDAIAAYLEGLTP